MIRGRRDEKEKFQQKLFRAFNSAFKNLYLQIEQPEIWKNYGHNKKFLRIKLRQSGLKIYIKALLSDTETKLAVLQEYILECQANCRELIKAELDRKEEEARTQAELAKNQQLLDKYGGIENIEAEQKRLKKIRRINRKKTLIAKTAQNIYKKYVLPSKKETKALVKRFLKLYKQKKNGV